MEFKKKEHKPVILLTLKMVKNYYKGGKILRDYNYGTEIVVRPKDIKVMTKGSGYVFYVDLRGVGVILDGEEVPSTGKTRCDIDFRKKGFVQEFPLFKLSFKVINKRGKKYEGIEIEHYGPTCDIRELFTGGLEDIENVIDYLRYRKFVYLG